MDYEKITNKEIEEFAESINWGLVPDELYEANKEKFKCLHGVQAREHMEVCFLILEMRQFPLYQHMIYFFSDDAWVMQFNLDTHVLSINYDIYLKLYNLKNKYIQEIKELKDDYIQDIIKACMSNYFKSKNIDAGDILFVRAGYNPIDKNDPRLQKEPSIEDVLLIENLKRKYGNLMSFNS